MQAIKSGTLMYVPQLLGSGNLTVRSVGAGLIAHLLCLFDFNWGPKSQVILSLINLLHQVEPLASAYFNLKLTERYYRPVDL